MTAPQSGTDPTSELRAEFLRRVGRHLRKQEGWWDDPEWSAVASDVWCELEDGAALAAAGTAPTPPTVSAEMIERIRERAIGSALEGPDPLMVELHAALTATTPPTVDVTALDEWKALVEAADRWDEETDRDRQRGAMGDTAVRAVKLLRAAVRAQGVPSTNPSGGAE